MGSINQAESSGIILIIEIIVLFAVKYVFKNLNVKNCTLSVQKH